MITLAQITQFISAQPDDRPVNMYHGNPDVHFIPGCVLLHYAEHHGISTGPVAFSEVGGEKLEPAASLTLIRLCPNKLPSQATETYADIKRRLAGLKPQQQFE